MPNPFGVQQRAFKLRRGKRALLCHNAARLCGTMVLVVSPSLHYHTHDADGTAQPMAAVPVKIDMVTRPPTEPHTWPNRSVASGRMMFVQRDVCKVSSNLLFSRRTVFDRVG